jgi:hypothetical protein
VPGSRHKRRSPFRESLAGASAVVTNSRRTPVAAAPSLLRLDHRLPKLGRNAPARIAQCQYTFRSLLGPNRVTGGMRAAALSGSRSCAELKASGADEQMRYLT